MPRIADIIRKPVFILSVILPMSLITELVVLEGLSGISLPADRGSAISSYEIRMKGTRQHFITRNTQFSIVDLWSKGGAAMEALVLRESFVSDREEGTEGDTAVVKVEALDGKAVRWNFEEAGEQGEPMGQVYKVTKFGCCAAPNTYTYFSLRDGKKLKSAHTELNREEFIALEKSLND